MDSAGGAAKQARDAKFQAILPLRGKPLNVEGEPVATVLSNNEFKSMIVALGCGFGENYNVEKLNYNKIIFLADADPDKLDISYKYLGVSLLSSIVKVLQVDYRV